MKKHLCIALLFAVLLLPAGEILVDAESFQDKGGWKVDQQFCHIMGSPYLLAHGMGVPVLSAKTTITVAEGGTYHIWVRTKNWVPGKWKAPGRFNVLINGEALATEFGTETGWTWQSGGGLELAKGKVVLELKDLTGFDGRCDAIYFSTDKTVPPNDLKGLRKLRNRLKGLPERPPKAGSFDVVIVGGGISGCAAALAAAEQKLNVALIHDRPILGGNASGEIRVHTLGIYGKGKDILAKIDTTHWPNGSSKALTDDRKRHKNMEASTVKLFLKWRAYDVVMDGKKIKSINARHIESGKVLQFDAPIFIDTTGDGWIGFWAGADFKYGREAADEYKESWAKHGELWSPKKADNRVMGTSLLFNSAAAETESDFPSVPWAMPVAGDHADGRGKWFWEYSANDKHQINDAEEIRDHMLRAIYGSFANLKKDPKYAKHRLIWVGYVGGKRESRRLLGDHIYTMQDVVKGTKFPDTVVEEKRAVDVHYQRKLKGAKQDFLSEALFHRVPKYYIPFRSLYSRNIENLMMAGRCFSCSHIGLGGPRVMRTCGQMGIATGYAASVCKRHKATPREVYKKHLQELLKLINGSTK